MITTIDDDGSAGPEAAGPERRPRCPNLPHPINDVSFFLSFFLSFLFLEKEKYL